MKNKSVRYEDLASYTPVSMVGTYDGCYVVIQKIHEDMDCYKKGLGAGLKVSNLNKITALKKRAAKFLPIEHAAEMLKSSKTV